MSNLRLKYLKIIIFKIYYKNFFLFRQWDLQNNLVIPFASCLNNKKKINFKLRNKFNNKYIYIYVLYCYIIYLLKWYVFIVYILISN